MAEDCIFCKIVAGRGPAVADIHAALDDSEDLRALLLRAEGDIFTGGADVKVFDRLSVEGAETFTRELIALTHRVESLPFPTLASVHGLCLTAGLERWNVVSRVLSDGELAEQSLRFARRLADGPTQAHAATKRMVRAFLEAGVRGADDRAPSIGAPLFGTRDLQRAVRSFLEEGPGKATFEGR